MLFFFSIVFTLFSLAGYYVYNRLSQAFPDSWVSSKWGLAVFIFLLFSFFAGKIWENASINIFSESLIRIGSIAAGYFAYAILFILFFDLLRLVNYFFPFFPDLITDNYSKAKYIVGLGSFGIISILMLIGYFNTINPKLKSLNLEINKPLSDFKTLNIVAVSDIHLGTWVNKKKVQRLVRKINELNPDVVLIGGDIIDDNIEVVKHHQLVEELAKIESKYGVYSCLGNHEYISRSHQQLEYFEQNGIRMIKDTAELVNNQFYVVGRDDIQGKSMNGVERKSLDSLLSDLDNTKPIILLDHQPYKLDEVSNHAVDLQFSGHTHNGQFWPLNYITGLMFEEDWGYLKKKNTHFYISSGYGTAVVPIRVGNDSEIVQFKIRNNNT